MKDKVPFPPLQGEGEPPAAYPHPGSASPTRPSPAVPAKPGGREKGRPASALPLGYARALRKRLTRQEAKLWVALRSLKPAGFHFRRQVPIGRCIVDFACLKHRLVIEIDGGHHGFDVYAAADTERDRALKALGFRVRRFWNAEVDRDLRSVMDDIAAHLDPTIAAASPPPQGEVAGAKRLTEGEPPAAYPHPGSASPTRPSPAGREKGASS